MKNFTTIQALIFGIAAGVALSIAVPVLAQNSADDAAKLQARQNAAVALGRSNYIKEVVAIGGFSELIIIEDHKRNRVCYLRNTAGSGPSCGPLNRNDVR